MPAMIRRGSNDHGNAAGPVHEWQRILVRDEDPSIKVDGVFGSKTEAATSGWQRDHKLIPDGVVGPATWGMALGTKEGTLPGGTVGAHMQAEGVTVLKPPVSTPGVQNGDTRAYGIAKAAGLGLTEAERQYALAVARGEGGYGASWAHPSRNTVELSKKFGLTGLEGAGSNNWGAEQGSGDAGSFPHVDRHADGKPYVGKYRRYSTPERGFEGFARVLYSGNKRREEGARELREAIARGSLRDAVFTQHRNGYFELAPEKYLESVLRNYAALSNNTGWTALLTESGRGLLGSSSGSATVGALGTVVALGAVGAVAAWFIFGRK